MARLAKYHNWLIYSAIHPPLRERIRQYASGRLVDIGCGNKPYSGLVAPYVQEHVGIDHAGSPHGLSEVDLVGSAYVIPVEDGSCDTVLCTDVLEHLERPSVAIGEAFRILRPGGMGIYTVPLFWHLHEAPRDFFRFTRFGLEYLFKEAGFEIVEIKALSGFWLTFGQALSYYLNRFRRRKVSPAYWAATALIPLVQAVGFLLNKVDRTESFTAEYIAVVRKPAKV